MKRGKGETVVYLISLCSPNIITTMLLTSASYIHMLAQNKNGFEYRAYKLNTNNMFRKMAN
jgi:hypothetical protein